MNTPSVEIRLWLVRSLLLSMAMALMAQTPLASHQEPQEVLVNRVLLPELSQMTACGRDIALGTSTSEEPLKPRGNNNQSAMNEQIETLAQCFALDSAYLKQRVMHKGMGQEALYRELNQCGLLWGGRKAESRYTLNAPKYSVNQQIVELALGYGGEGFDGFDPDTEAFKRGRQYILSVQPATIAHYYPFPFTKASMMNSVLGNVLSIGTLPLLGGEIGPSHTAMGVVDGVFVETSEEDVIITRAIDSYLKMREDGAGVLVQEIPSIDKEQREEAARYILAQVGKPYDYLALIVGYDAGENSIYCTELVDRALKQAGIALEYPEAYTLQDTVIGKVLNQDYADEELGRISPWEGRSATVNGEPLVDVFTWFPKNYQRDMPSVRLGLATLPSIQGP